MWEVAEELPVDTEKLMLEPAIENHYEDNGGENEQLIWSRECRKIDDQESLDELDAQVEFLSQSRQIYKEKIDKAEAIKVANNLLRLGVSIDVIPQVTGVPAAKIF